MGVPTSAVGYTAAMPRREDHEVHKDMWWGHWTKKESPQGHVVALDKNRKVHKDTWWHWTKKESPQGHVVALDKKRKSTRTCGWIGQKNKFHKDMWWNWTIYIRNGILASQMRQPSKQGRSPCCPKQSTFYSETVTCVGTPKHVAVCQQRKAVVLDGMVNG